MNSSTIDNNIFTKINKNSIKPKNQKLIPFNLHTQLHLIKYLINSTNNFIQPLQVQKLSKIPSS